MKLNKGLLLILLGCFCQLPAVAQHPAIFRVIRKDAARSIEVYLGDSLLTRFMYSDSLEKPILFPIMSRNSHFITRGFPLQPRPGEPHDHPHHTGLWMNFENVDGLDFWNNSYAIPVGKKASYGRIRTTEILKTGSGSTGHIIYRASWQSMGGEKLLDEVTTFTFRTARSREGLAFTLIDRSSELTAERDVSFKDSKDGFLGLRLAHELEQPADRTRVFTDSRGNTTNIEPDTGHAPGGKYLAANGKSGDSVWSSRAPWCELKGKLGIDSMGIVIFDHKKNFNYPAFWHARGYGLFAANPFGEAVFTHGKSAKNLKLLKGEQLVFRYRLLFSEGRSTPSISSLNALGSEFSSSR